MPRVLVTLRVDAGAGAELRLDAPPDASAPSVRWMARLAELLRPLPRGEDDGDEAGSGGTTLRCCIPGTLEEVSGHLWQHQVLWMRLRVPGSEERLDALHLSELLEPGADFSSGQYSNVVSLEEDTPGGDGEVTVAIELEAVSFSPSSPPPPPSLPLAFVLELEALDLAELGGGAVARELRLRCSGVEQPLSRGALRHTLVLVEAWAEVLEALVDLGACVQVPLDDEAGARRPGDFAEVPVDLAPLGARCLEGGGEEVRVEVSSAPVPALSGEPLRFLAIVRCRAWMGDGEADADAAFAGAGPAFDPSLGAPGPSRDMELHARSVLVGPRLWRVSVEVRSVRLTTRNANVFAAYTYGPFKQPRAFRTSPPTLARRNATVYLPHAFSAYTLMESEEALRAALEEPLEVELWVRDIYRKDGPIGVVEAAIGSVFDRPLQESATMPSMVHGFRVLDQVCPIVSSEDPEPKRIGALRLLVFLEDLGFQGRGAASAAAAAPLAAKAPTAALASAPAPFSSLATSPPLRPAEEPPMAAVAHAGPRRSAPPSSTPYELELWRRVEEEKFRAYLIEQEAAMRQRVEEEFMRREAARAEEFQRTQAELRGVEARVRQKLQELQAREAAVAAQEARLAAFKEDAERRAELLAQESEEAARRKVAELQQDLELARSRNKHHQERMEELEADLASARQRGADLEEQLDEGRRKLAESPLAQAQRELQAAQAALREQRAQTEAVAASRDHFRRKVEELCARLLDQQQPPPRHKRGPPAASAAVPAATTKERSWAPLAPGAISSARSAPEGADLGEEVSQALRRIQQDLSQLAREWGPDQRLPPPRCAAGAAAQAPSGRTAAFSPPASEHLLWLLRQRDELLDSGVHEPGDAVLLALEARIADASGAAAAAL